MTLFGTLRSNPSGWPVARVLSNADEGRAAVEELVASGVDCIKVYNEIGLEAFEAIEVAARAHGVPLIGHVPHAVGLARTRDFEAQHLTGVPYRSLPRPPIGWDICNEDLLALSDDEIDLALDVSFENRVSYTPAIANFTLRLIASDPVRFPPTEGSEVLPAYWAKAWDLVAGHPSTEEAIRLKVEAAPVIRSIVRRARARGIDVLAGTDTLMPWVVPGEALHLEMAELSQAFGDEEAALAAATTINGRHLGHGRIGVLAVGAKADILLLRQDPTVNLAALREWEILFSGGRRYDRSVVDQWVDEYREYFHGWFQNHIMGAVAGLATGQFSHDLVTTSERAVRSLGPTR